MYFITSEGNKVGYGQPFTTGGVQYPANWLRSCTLLQKLELGLTVVEDVVSRKSHDPRWQKADGTYLDLDLVKDRMIKEFRSLAFSSLGATDWYVTRAAEGVAPIPAEIAAERATIRAEHDSKQEQVRLASSIEELKLI